MLRHIVLLYILFLLKITLLAQSYAIRDVTLIPLDRNISIPHQTVLIENGIISKLQPWRKCIGHEPLAPQSLGYRTFFRRG